jgi:hypothetical protein
MMVFWAFLKQISILKRENLTENWQMGMRNWFLGKVPHNSDYQLQIKVKLMIVISGGMQKAGSAWFFNMTNDLLMAAGNDDVRVVRENFKLQPILTRQNCNLGKPQIKKLIKLMRPHYAGYSFVIKTHAPPNTWVNLLKSFGIIKLSYIYRDPRDAALAAFERGEKKREQGKSGSFTEFQSVEDAIVYFSRIVKNYDRWIKCPDLFLVKYEELVEQPKTILTRLNGFLGLEISSEDIDKIVQKYSPDHMEDHISKLLSFNKGKIGRFRDVFNETQQKICKYHFDEYIKKMGYLP